MDFTEEENKELEVTTRSGYILRDVARNFLQCLGEAGSNSAGKLIHYTADMICSGGLLLFEKLCFEYAFDHIGIASPRIFLYLQQQFKELREKAAQLDFNKFCNTTEVQQKCTEIVLILQGCPKKSKPKYPTIPGDTHENENWLRSVLRTTDKACVRKVYQRNSDLEQLLHAGNEMVFAIMEGATERALFWAKWLLEEDAITRKKFGSGLSTIERGPPGLKNANQKASVGYYLISVLAELYKEFSQKGMVRLHQEFQALLDLYRSIDQKNTQRRKMDTLCVMVQILVDMPRMKVPAAPTLVQDPSFLQRIVEQSDTFFKEVLFLPIPKKFLPNTVTGIKKKKSKEPNKEEKLQQQLAMIDQVAMNYYKM
jgi:hypothetical protein